VLTRVSVNSFASLRFCSIEMPFRLFMMMTGMVVPHSACMPGCDKRASVLRFRINGSGGDLTPGLPAIEIRLLFSVISGNFPGIFFEHGSIIVHTAQHAHRNL
jgi:hypothetical protein